MSNEECINAYRAVLGTIRAYGKIDKETVLSKGFEKRYNRELKSIFKQDTDHLFSEIMHSDENYEKFAALTDGVSTEYFDTFVRLACAQKAQHLERLAQTLDRPSGILGRIKWFFSRKKRRKAQEKAFEDYYEGSAKLGTVFEKLPKIVELGKNMKGKDFVLSKESRAEFNTFYKAYADVINGLDLGREETFINKDKVSQIDKVSTLCNDIADRMHDLYAEDAAEAEDAEKSHGLRAEGDAASKLDTDIKLSELGLDVDAADPLAVITADQKEGEPEVPEVEEEPDEYASEHKDKSDTSDLDAEPEHKDKSDTSERDAEPENEDGSPDLDDEDEEDYEYDLDDDEDFDDSLINGELDAAREDEHNREQVKPEEQEALNLIGSNVILFKNLDEAIAHSDYASAEKFAAGLAGYSKKIDKALGSDSLSRDIKVKLGRAKKMNLLKAEYIKARIKEGDGRALPDGRTKYLPDSVSASKGDEIEQYIVSYIGAQGDTIDEVESGISLGLDVDIGRLDEAIKCLEHIERMYDEAFDKDSVDSLEDRQEDLETMQLMIEKAQDIARDYREKKAARKME